MYKNFLFFFSVMREVIYAERKELREESLEDTGQRQD